MTQLSSCPLCGEELQVTVKQWFTGVTIAIGSNDDYDLVDVGAEQYPLANDRMRIDRVLGDVYCRNFHSFREMVERVTLIGVER